MSWYHRRWGEAGRYGEPGRAFPKGDWRGGRLAASNRWAGAPYAVVKKFGDDNANLVVVALAWYGFTAIFPLLLVVVTIFGLIGEASIGTSVLHTLQEFPVVGADFNPASEHALHGSTLGWSSACSG